MRRRMWLALLAAAKELALTRQGRADLSPRLVHWLESRPEVGPSVRIDAVQHPQSNGMSHDTLLLDVSWERSSGARVSHRFAARLGRLSDLPIYRSCDLPRQAHVMTLVGERTAAPVPRVRWCEPDDGPIGTPFLVMDRVDGRVPPDLMPYTFAGSWLHDAASKDRTRLQDHTVDVLAAIHEAEATEEELTRLQPAGTPSSTPLARHFAEERSYHQWARGDLRFPLVDRAFEWLEARWPRAADQAAPVISWGDARIGNIVYQGFEPKAVLDWEAATVGPRELDLGWLVFMHRFFDDVATDLGMDGLPGFLDPAGVSERYSAASGHEPRDLGWFVAYAAVRHASVMIRAIVRSLHSAGRPLADDPDDLLVYRQALERLTSGAPTQVLMTKHR